MTPHEKYQHFKLAHVQEMASLKAAGHPNKEIARVFNTHAHTVAKYLRHYQRYGDTLFSYCPTEVA